MPADNGFSKWENYILKELKRLGDVVIDFNKKLDEINIAIGVLKMKSGIWGAIAGLIPASIVILYLILK